MLGHNGLGCLSTSLLIITTVMTAANVRLSMILSF